MSNIEIMHTARGFQRSNHKYISRKMVNGHWVYEYAKNATSNVSGALRKASSAANAAAEYIDPNGPQVAARRQAKVAQNNANALARKTSAQSRERAARLRKVRRQRAIARGEAKVNEIINQTKSAAQSRANETKAYYKRQHEGKVAGMKAAKQSRERQLRNAKIQTTKKVNATKSAVKNTATKAATSAKNKATSAAKKAYEAPQNLNKKINKSVASSKYNPDVLKTRAKKKVRKTQRKLNAAQKAYSNTR